MRIATKQQNKFYDISFTNSVHQTMNTVCIFVKLNFSPTYLNFMKQNSFYFLILLILFGCNACNKDNSTQLTNGVAVSLPHLWVVQTRGDNTKPTGGPVFSSIVYNGNALVSGSKNGQNSLILLNVQSGGKIWEWQDWIESRSDVWVQKPFVKDNLLFFQIAYWNYCIDLNNGKTVFKNVFNQGFEGNAYGLGDYLYSSYGYNRTGNSFPTNGSTVYRASIKNGVPEFIAQPKYDTTNPKPIGVYGNIVGIAPYLINNDTCLAISFGDPQVPNGYKDKIGIYNVTQKKWNIEGTPIEESGLRGIEQQPQIWQNKIYLCGPSFVSCYDAITSKYIWRVTINGDFLFSGFIIQNGKVYANDSYGNLHCIDAITSKEYWVEPTSGTSSDMVYLDGVVYLVGGGDGLLHAIDAETGTTLWKVKSPDASKYNDGYFDRFCAAVPGSFASKGRIIVSTGYNAYCYEAAK